MEKEILEILKSIQLDIKGLKDEVKDLKEGQKIIEKKLDGVVEQTADLVEFRNEILNKVDGIREDLSTVELVRGSVRKMRISHVKSIFPADTNGLQTF